MLRTQFGSFLFHFGELAQERINSVPLSVVGTLHVCTKLCRSSVEMPEIESVKADLRGKWRGRDDAILNQSVHDHRRLFHFGGDIACYTVCLGVFILDKRPGVAVHANRDHRLASLESIGAVGRHGSKQEFGKALANIMSCALCSKATHVACCACRSRHVSGCETTPLLRPVPFITLCMIHNAMGGLRVNFFLRMIRTQMTLPTYLWFADLFKREFMTKMALVAISD